MSLDNESTPVPKPHPPTGRPSPAGLRRASFRLLAFVALSMLRKSKVSFGLLLGAVAVGVGFQIPNSANLHGYNLELINNKVVRATGHVLVTARDRTLIPEVDPLLTALRGMAFVRQATAQLRRGGIVIHHGTHQEVRVVGLDPSTDQGATDMCRRLATGHCFGTDAEDEVVLGNQLARRLKAKAGDSVRLVVPHQELGELAYASDRYRVAGIVAGGGDFQEDQDLFMPIGHLRKVVGEYDVASLVMVFGADATAADQYAGTIATRFPELSVEPWWQVSSFVTDTIRGNQTIANVSMTMVVIAVMIPVLALLYIYVLAEKRQISIILALGLRRREILAIYLLKAVIVGTLGCAIGIGVGLGICAYFNLHPIYQNSGFAVRPVLDATVIGVPVAVIFLTTLLAGLLPAILAARANPALELQGD